MKLQDRQLYPAIITVLLIALVFSSSSTAILLLDKGNGGPDTVTFTLFRAHATSPDMHLLWNNGWQIVAWNSSGITYQSIVHNGMTNCYVNFLQYQVASTAKNSSGLGYIGLSTNSTSPVTADQKTKCTMQGEITANGLGRAAGTTTLNSTALSNLVVNFKVVHVFTATGTVSNIYLAGLTYVGVAACSATYPNGCFIALAQLPNVPINMGSTDQLTVTWVNQWTGT